MSLRVNQFAICQLMINDEFIVVRFIFISNDVNKKEIVKRNLDLLLHNTNKFLSKQINVVIVYLEEEKKTEQLFSLNGFLNKKFQSLR